MGLRVQDVCGLALRMLRVGFERGRAGELFGAVVHKVDGRNSGPGESTPRLCFRSPSQLGLHKKCCLWLKAALYVEST